MDAHYVVDVVVVVVAAAAVVEDFNDFPFYQCLLLNSLLYIEVFIYHSIYTSMFISTWTF